MGVVCCQVEVSPSGRSLIRRSPTECGVSECDREASRKRRPWSSTVCRPTKKINSSKQKTRVVTQSEVFHHTHYESCTVRSPLMTVHGRCQKQTGVYKPQVPTFASRPKIIGTSSGCNNLVTSCPGAYQKMTFIVRFAVPPPTSTSCRITYQTTRRKRNKWWTWGRQDKGLVRQEIVIGITQLLWIILKIVGDILDLPDDLHQILLSESTEEALRYVSTDDRNGFSTRMLLPRSVNRFAVVLLFFAST